MAFTDDNALTEEEGDTSDDRRLRRLRPAGRTRRSPPREPCTSALYRLAPGRFAAASCWPGDSATRWRWPGARRHGARRHARRRHARHPAGAGRPGRDLPPPQGRLVRLAGLLGGARCRSPTRATARRPSIFAARAGPPRVRDRPLAASGLRPRTARCSSPRPVPHAALGGMTVVPPGGPFARWSGQLWSRRWETSVPPPTRRNPDVRAGFQVEAVDLATGRRTVFARNRGAGPAQPASRLDLEDGFERPVDVKVGPDGLVYVLDFGVFEPTATAAKKSCRRPARCSASSPVPPGGRGRLLGAALVARPRARALAGAPPAAAVVRGDGGGRRARAAARGRDAGRGFGARPRGHRAPAGGNRRRARWTRLARPVQSSSATDGWRTPMVERTRLLRRR